MLCGDEDGLTLGFIIFPWRAWHADDVKITKKNLVINLEFLIFSSIVT